MNILKDNRPIRVKREKRGLFITSSGIRINADVNGSLNIHRKFIVKVANDVPKEPVGTGLVMNPIKIKLRTNYSIEFLYSLINLYKVKLYLLKVLIFLID